MVRDKQLQANIWKLYVMQACRWFLLLMPVLVLFYQENGLLFTPVLYIGGRILK